MRTFFTAIEFTAGEEMLTEVSCKFRSEAVSAQLATVGLERTRCWTDDAGDFGLALAVKQSPCVPAEAHRRDCAMCALITTVTTDQSAPVITGQRLRKGACGSPRGAARMIGDTLATVARPH